jgi:probable addiction module antidote protein
MEMPAGFSKLDIADLLRTPEQQAAYLDVVLEEGGDDPAFVVKALETIARARGMTQLARDTGMSRAGVYKALSPDGNPEFATILKMINALGLRLHVSPA